MAPAGTSEGGDIFFKVFASHEALVDDSVALFFKSVTNARLADAMKPLKAIDIDSLTPHRGSNIIEGEWG